MTIATGDPRAPREKDLPRAVPSDASALASLDDAKIIAAPDDPRHWDEWRRALGTWRDDARRRIGYDGARYERPATAWTQRCFALGMLWLFDEQLYDHRAHAFRVPELLAASARTGGFDAVVLWHTYPDLGIDDRDQFELARDIPTLPEVVRAFRAAGVRVLLEYLPWDRRGGDDTEAIARLAQETGADGIFLDTMREAPAGLAARLERDDRVLETESNIPLARLADHHLSWAQWQADSAVPGVHRAKWFEPRHMLHETRRWDTDRWPQLRSAWLNGAGMVVWENVFGSAVPWHDRDAATFAAMLAVQRAYAAHFSHGEWTPLADPADDGPAVHAHRFALGGSRLWTVAASERRALGAADALAPAARDGERWFELLTGTELAPRVRGGVARVVLPELLVPFAAVLAVPERDVDDALRELLRSQAARRWPS